jgi:hypothetical protein
MDRALLPEPEMNHYGKHIFLPLIFVFYVMDGQIDRETN